jgi:hypothetical protein
VCQATHAAKPDEERTVDCPMGGVSSTAPRLYRSVGISSGRGWIAHKRHQQHQQAMHEQCQ